MKPFPDKFDLRIMWTVATSTSIETGTPAYEGFARMLYDYITEKKPRVELNYDFHSPETSTNQET